MIPIQRVINKIKLRFYDSESWKYHLTMLELLYPNATEKKKNSIILKKIDLKIERDEALFLLKGYSDALALKEECNSLFSLKNKELYIEVSGLIFKVQTTEEIFILKEIFVDGIYNFCLDINLDSYVLIDIGMNVSFASCYFAGIKKVSKILSFEPFTPTFLEAQENIRRNNFENIIEARNYGLGDKDKELSVEYTPEFKGQVGVQGVDYIRSHIEKTRVENIVIKGVHSIFTEIGEKYKNNSFILKIDCEGAEYELINNIPQSILDSCDIIMMEWHEKGAKRLEEWLLSHHFILMSFSPHSKRVGMIYAIKHKI